MNKDSIIFFLDRYLKINTIKDNSCNGLQVEGADRIERIGLAVDACMETFVKAKSEKCQMVICHHGIIWNGLTHIKGYIYKQIKFLIENKINLYVAHLPLDIHPVVGNNIQLIKMLNLKKTKPFGNLHGILLGYGGSFDSPLSIEELKKIIEKKLNTKSILLPFGPEKIQKVAIISGGGYKELEQAIEERYDCYITGEPSHSNYHIALENRINVIYAGHYATETPCVKAIGKILENKFKIKTIFLDTPTTI